MTIQKQYARRILDDSIPVYGDQFRYRSVADLDAAEVMNVFRRGVAESNCRDIDRDAEDEFAGLVAFAGSAYAPENWMIVYDEQEPIGFVFPQRYHDYPSLGSIFMIGILPEHRNKGLGKVLHAKGLSILREIGVEQYVGSTDVNNAAMIRVFETNGCRLTEVREVEVIES